MEESLRFVAKRTPQCIGKLKVQNLDNSYFILNFAQYNFIRVVDNITDSRFMETFPKK